MLLHHLLALKILVDFSASPECHFEGGTPSKTVLKDKSKRFLGCCSLSLLLQMKDMLVLSTAGLAMDSYFSTASRVVLHYS